MRIVEMLGMPPGRVLAKAQHTKKYFRREEELANQGGIPVRRYKYTVSEYVPRPLQHGGSDVPCHYEH